MSAPPAALRLTREDLPGAPGWIERILDANNLFQAQTSAALSRGLTFADNFAAQVVAVDVVAPSPVWSAPSLQNGWLQQSGRDSLGYRIDAGGAVWIRGAANSGTISTTLPMFTLPAGYRPNSRVDFAVVSNGAFGRVVITTDGGVAPATGSNVLFSVEGLHFQAATPCAAPIRPTGAGWPLALQTTIPGVSCVMVVGASDLDAGASAPTTLAPSTLPEWRMGTSGRLQVLHVPGLSPGRKYRLTFLLLAG